MSRLKVLVTGGAGQLALAIAKTWHDHDLIIPDEMQFDLGSRNSILSGIQEFKPDVVLNAGAFTQVDRCESEVALAMDINGRAVTWLAEGCASAQALLVQISTDYVFDGSAIRPYRETDSPNPISVYGRSKWAGELAAATAPQHLIMRTSWLYDAWGKNFYLTMKRAATQGKQLRVVDDQIGSPTSARALARQIQVAVTEGWRGLVHSTCSGETSWYGFAWEIFAQCGLRPDLEPCASTAYATPVARPKYSVLDGSRRGQLGTDVMPEWREALAEVVADSGNL